MQESTKLMETREGELDSLISVYEQRVREERERALAERESQADPVEKLRSLMDKELIPAFGELGKKYRAAGFTMKLDASTFLAGERELMIELGFKDHRSELCGVVTREAIAFSEIRRVGDTGGEISGGPSLRLRSLTTSTFREFVCERLGLLMRAAMRGR